MVVMLVVSGQPMLMEAVVMMKIVVELEVLMKTVATMTVGQMLLPGGAPRVWVTRASGRSAVVTWTGGSAVGSARKAWEEGGPGGADAGGREAVTMKVPMTLVSLMAGVAGDAIRAGMMVTVIMAIGMVAWSLGGAASWGFAAVVSAGRMVTVLTEMVAASSSNAPASLDEPDEVPPQGKPQGDEDAA